MVRNKRFVTRSEYAEENKRLTTIHKIGKHLNIYILIVAALTVIILAFTIMTNGTDEATPDHEAEEAVTAEQPAVEEPVEGLVTEEQPVAQEQVETVEDPVVGEVRTNPAWAPYPTQQTGPHTSTFEKGHIDYEEKLAAIFSVTDLVQEDSFIKSVRNNGSASSAIAVVTSKDGAKMYRVSIEWLDGQGWKPVKLEVLKTLEGAY